MFAGWRMAYVKRAGAGKTRGCLFCRLQRPGDDRARGVVKRLSRAYLVLNSFPYNSGHLMIAVKRHVGTVGGLDRVERKQLWELAALAEEILGEVYQPQGLNLGVNLGRAAGAGVDGHLHVHLVPRWSGDTNFMVTVGDTKVLPEDLDDTYRRLTDALRRGGKPRRAASRRTR
ncbi:MAG TPA: HIT domain-containing protein [Candidatus Eisenbacteria bacterium]|nr:HIT domain-containing protein [Candidatus Eisenbacteria bacterium]